MSRYSCTNCNRAIPFGEEFYPKESGNFCESCYDKLSVTVHKVMVTLQSGLTYTSENASFNSAWVDALQFIVKSGEEVNQTVSYRIQKFQGV